MGESLPLILACWFIVGNFVSVHSGSCSVGQPITSYKSYYDSPAQEYSCSTPSYSVQAYSASANYDQQCQVQGGYKGVCKPLAACAQYYGSPAHYNPLSNNYYQSCQYGYGSRGVCCPEIGYSGPKPAVLQYKPPPNYGYSNQYTDVPKEAVLRAFSYAQQYLDKTYRNDAYLGRGEDDPSYWGNGVAKEEYYSAVKPYGDVGFFIHAVTDYLHREYGYSADAIFTGGGLKLTEYSKYLPGNYSQVCNSFYQQCSYSKYRSIDGSCNNLKNPYYGQANTILGRIRPPRYADKVYSVRASVDHGYPLPTPRPLRYYALPDKNVEESTVSMLYVNFGQFVTHDLVHTPFYQAEDGQFLDCCYTYQGGHHQVNPKCYALPVPNDPFYSKTTRETCLNFARAVVAPNYDCKAGYSNPINIQTSHLDLSLQYGRGDQEAQKLRLHRDGLLHLSHLGNREYLPLDSNAECFNSSQGFCFASGDLRTTIHPGITVMQTLSSRFHNFIARQLIYQNPYWTDEQLYQEARKINIAVFQHITYSEYLPLLLGWQFMYDHGILPTTKGYSYAYDENAKPWIYAEFSGAAFRLHTSVYGNIILANEYYRPEKELKLQDYFNNAILFKDPYNFDKLLRGYILAPSRKHDKYYDPALTNYLLKDERHFGLDLASFNIHRGRDYGLGSYNDYREICGLPRAVKWSDFYDWLDPKTVNSFKKIYRHPDDVDLYAGGVAEQHFPDSLLGPTWWCIVGFQFQRLKLSDRYFYDLGNQPHSFTLPQLDEIRKMSISALLCLTTGVTHVPALGFRTISPGNPLISCSDYEALPRINFAPWQTGSGHYEL